MAKIFFNNENFNQLDMPNNDKPYKLPIDLFLMELYAKYQLDISSELKTIYLSEAQKQLFEGRAKNFYFETWLPKQIVLDVLNNMDCVQAFAVSPCHDMDTFENGTRKKPHFHIILQFTTNYAYSKIVKAFHTTQIRKLGEHWFYEYHYLYHGTDKAIKEGKYLYDENEIISNDIDYIRSKAVITNKEFTFKDLVYDIEMKKSTRYLINKYDTFYARFKDSAYSAVERIKIEEHTPDVKKISKVVDMRSDLLIFYNDGSSNVISKQKIINEEDFLSDEEN